MDEDRSAPTTSFVPQDPTAALPLIALWPRARLGVSATLKKLEEIDTSTQSFVADVVIQLRLRDERSGGPSVAPPLSHPDQVRVFSVIELENALEIFSKELWTDYDNGLFLYNIRVRGRFSCSLDLRAFPRDVQRLQVTLRSRLEARELVFVEAWEVGRCASDADEAARVALDEVGFKLSDTWVLGLGEGQLWRARSWSPHSSESLVALRFRRTKPEESLSRLQYWRVHFDVFVRRRPETVDSLAVLSLMFSFVAVVAAIILTDAAHGSERLATEATLLVTSQAFRDAVSTLLPPISYETHFSRLVLRVSVLLVLLTLDAICALALSTVAHDLQQQTQEPLAGGAASAPAGWSATTRVALLGALDFLSNHPGVMILRDALFSAYMVGMTLDYALGEPPHDDDSRFVSLVPGLRFFAPSTTRAKIDASPFLEPTLDPDCAADALTDPFLRRQSSIMANSDLHSQRARSLGYMVRFRVNRAGNTVAEVVRTASADADAADSDTESDATPRLHRAKTPTLVVANHALDPRRAPTPVRRKSSAVPPPKK